MSDQLPTGTAEQPRRRQPIGVTKVRYVPRLRIARPARPVSTSRLVMAWGAGWAVSRGVSPIAVIPGGFRADVGRPGHQVRYVLHTYTPESLADLGRRVTGPGAWIKICGPAADLRGALSGAWTMFDTGHLMTAPLGETDPSPEAGIAVADGVTTVTIEDRASGRLVLRDGFGIVDQVETDPAHRRRGLGTAVMRTLEGWAACRGAHTGILIATDEGRALYGRLGWTVRSPVAAGFMPG
jgi:GNAT superfamily N-acetyltransferase